MVVMPEKTARTAISLLDAYDPAKYNVLTPTIAVEQISPIHQIKVQQVSIDPDTAGGDVFHMGEGKYYLSAAARRRLAAVAGIQQNYRESGFIADTPTRITYQAIGAIQDASGQWRILTATKTLDLEQIRKAKGYTEERVKNIWQYRYERAETGAWSRLYTAALGLKTTYSRDELAKPFIVPRVVLSPDWTDPEVKRMLTARALDAQAAVFGPATGRPGRPALAAGSAPASSLKSGAAVVDLDAAAGPDTGLPEDETPEGAPPADEPPMASGPGEATAGPSEPQRGRDGQGEWVRCQGAGCAEIIRPAPGKSVDDVVRYCTERFGRVLCRKCIAAAQSGGLFS